MEKKWYNLFVSVDQPEGGVAPDGSTASDDSAPIASRGPGASATQPLRQPGAPAAPLTAAQSVAQIAAALQAQPRMTAAGTTVSFDEIYKLADIQTPSHGYTIGKIAAMLDSEHMRGLPPNVKKASVLTA